MKKKYLGRIALLLIIGIFLGFALSEISFQLLKENNRKPGEVVLQIPPGTADKIANGEDPPGLPTGMSFVVGDTLVVENNDTENHQLGPLWIPAGQTGRLNLEEENNFTFTCSFSDSNFFGLDVEEPVTVWTRITGALFAGIPLAAILILYSLTIWPIRSENEVTDDQENY